MHLQGTTFETMQNPVECVCAWYSVLGTMNSCCSSCCIHVQLPQLHTESVGGSN